MLPQNTQNPKSITRNQVWAVFAILLLILLVGNGRISLWNQDEAAYAGFGWNMLRTGNWLIPEYMWSEIHRKPPLHFWLIASAFKVFGANEWATRLHSALAIFGVYLLMYFQGRKFFGPSIALMATVVLGTSLYIPLLGKIAFTDGLLLFWSTLCGFGLLHILQFRSWKWVLIFWLSLAMGLLTKGPPIILFTGQLWLLLLILHPQRRNLIISHPWFFGPLALIPLVLWGYLTSLQDGGTFIQWLWDWYGPSRVDSAVLGQTGPPGYYLVTFLLFFLPWLVFFPGGIVKGVGGLWRKEPAYILLISWFISGWLLYEFLASKLPSYAAAAYPALAFLIAYKMEGVLSRKTQSGFVVIAGVFQLVLVLAVVAGLSYGSMYLDYAAGVLPIAVGVLFLAGTAISVWFLFRKEARKGMILMAANAALFLLLVWGLLLPSADDLKDSTKRVALTLKEIARPESTVVLANKSGSPPSLPFYVFQEFEKVEDDLDTESILLKYLSSIPHAFVVNEEQKNRFLEADPALKPIEISSFSTDRVQAAKYFVVVNKAGRK